MKTTTRRVGLLSGLFLILAGCGAQDPSSQQSVENGNAGVDNAGAATPEKGAGAQEKGADIASTQEAVYSGWTAYTSEEYPPISCDSGALMNSVQCSGSYCDNIRAYCQPTAGSAGGSYWTGYFSEESTNYRYCSAGYWVTGFACNGSYCDNIALQCTYIYNVSSLNCYWTGWVSEEGGGTISFGYHYYPQGMQCNGSNCDNKRFYVCQTGP